MLLSPPLLHLLQNLLSCRSREHTVWRGRARSICRLSGAALHPLVVGVIGRRRLRRPFLLLIVEPTGRWAALHLLVIVLLVIELIGRERVAVVPTAGVGFERCQSALELRDETWA